MQENWVNFYRKFDRQRHYVLATISATEGSTYYKTGAMMLITQAGDCIGLLSGGCLEADICHHAQALFDSSKSKLLRYDLMSDEALLWGLGLGCDGAIEIILTSINPANSFLGFDKMLDSVINREGGFYCQLIADDAIAQAEFCLTETDVDNFIAQLADDDNSTQTLIVPITPPLSIVVCGAGPDAEPLVNMLSLQGWQVSLWDHRPTYLAQTCFDTCQQRRKVRAEAIRSDDFAQHDGVVIMTHNLAFDQDILTMAWHSSLSYIGLLGPKGRRNKLIAPLNLTEGDIQGRIYGPVGLALGGRGPQAIALSITAEIQQHFSQRRQST
ncbi:XdhC family protein [Thalassotalea ganghwensis]